LTENAGRDLGCGAEGAGLRGVGEGIGESRLEDWAGLEEADRIAESMTIGREAEAESEGRIARIFRLTGGGTKGL